MRRLGLLQHDPHALAAVTPLYGAFQPPPRLDRSHIAFTPGLWLNDKIGDCVAVALANAARGTAFVQTGDDIVVDPAKVPAAFAAWVGCADTIEAMSAVDGVQMLHAYGYASANGFDLGEQVALVPTWYRIEKSDRFALAHALLKGPQPIGVSLSLSDDKTTGALWDLDAPAGAGDQTPGSWGGHAVIVWDYTGRGDTDTVRIGTWGAWQTATWRWVHSRLDEAYSVGWRQLENAEPMA